MDHAADFFIASNHRIELPAPRLFSEITGIAFERLVLGFGILVSNTLRSADRSKRFEDGLVSGAVTSQKLLGSVALELRNGE